MAADSSGHLPLCMAFIRKVEQDANLRKLRNVEELSTVNWRFDRHSMHDLAQFLPKRRLGPFEWLGTAGEGCIYTSHGAH